MKTTNAIAMCAAAAMLVGACAATEEAIPVETTAGGQRLAVEGVFEIVAPVVIRSGDELVFESVATRRDVVFRDFTGGEDSRESRVRLLNAVAGGTSGPDASIGCAGPSGGIGVERANHVRVRRDGRDRYLVDLVDCTFERSPPSADEYPIAWTEHLEIDASRD